VEAEDGFQSAPDEGEEPPCSVAAAAGGAVHAAKQQDSGEPCHCAPLAVDTVPAEQRPVEDNSTQQTPVAEAPLPPSWAYRASSMFTMDSSMVLTCISMALPSGSSTSPQGDALDFDLPHEGGEGGLVAIEEADDEPEEEEAFDDSMFDDAAAVAHSLEQKLPTDTTNQSGVSSAAAVGSTEFSLGRVSPIRTSIRNSSRLRAPRGSFHFFDKTAPAGQKAESNARSSLTLSRSIDDLFNVSTPVRFKTGPSHRAEEPNVFASFEQKPSAKKAIRNKSLFPGGMSCPGPLFGDLCDEDESLQRSPSSWLFPVHPLAQQSSQFDEAEASAKGLRSSGIKEEDKPLKLYGSATSLNSGSNRRSTGTSDGVRRSGASSASSDSQPRSLTATAEAFKKKQQAASSAARSSQSPTSSAAGRPKSAHTARYGGHRRSTSVPVRSSAASTGSRPSIGARPDPAASSAAGNQGVLFVSQAAAGSRAGKAGLSLGAGASENTGIHAEAPSQVAAPTAFQKMLAKGVSRLRMPGSFGSKAAAAPSALLGAETPANADEEEAAAPPKRTFSWSRPPAVFSTPSGPGKRRRKAEPEGKPEAAAAEGSSTPATPRANSSNGMMVAAGQATPKSMAQIALKKFTSPLHGFKKSAAKLLSTPKSKKPREPTGDDLSAIFDVYAAESPTFALKPQPGQ